MENSSDSPRVAVLWLQRWALSLLLVKRWRKAGIRIEER